MAQNVEKVAFLSSPAVKKTHDGKRAGRHGNYHYWLKRWLNRKERRTARKLLDFAPTSRMTKGWED